ncbi:MAG: nickel-type superoxide dismutase maturation protease [Acidimicrobiales bacterium]
MGGSSSAHYRVVVGALAGLVAALLVARSLRPLTRVVVSGESMRPTLGPGDRLLVLRVGRAGPGRLVTLEDPRHPGRLMVKRVVRRWVDGLEVVGDNPASSTDSRSFGPVSPRSVRGRVVYRYFPEARRGRL